MMRADSALRLSWDLVDLLGEIGEFELQAQADALHAAIYAKARASRGLPR